MDIDFYEKDFSIKPKDNDNEDNDSFLDALCNNEFFRRSAEKYLHEGIHIISPRNLRLVGILYHLLVHMAKPLYGKANLEINYTTFTCRLTLTCVDFDFNDNRVRKYWRVFEVLQKDIYFEVTAQDKIRLVAPFDLFEKLD